MPSWITLTLWFCSNGRPFINFIIVWLDFQVNFSIFKTDFSAKAPGHANVTFVPARATIFLGCLLSDSVWYEKEEKQKWIKKKCSELFFSSSPDFVAFMIVKLLCITMLHHRLYTYTKWEKAWVIQALLSQHFFLLTHLWKIQGGETF